MDCARLGFREPLLKTLEILPAEQIQILDAADLHSGRAGLPVSDIGAPLATQPIGFRWLNIAHAATPHSVQTPQRDSTGRWQRRQTTAKRFPKVSESVGLDRLFLSRFAERWRCPPEKSFALVFDFIGKGGGGEGVRTLDPQLAKPDMPDDSFLFLGICRPHFVTFRKFPILQILNLNHVPSVIHGRMQIAVLHHLQRHADIDGDAHRVFLFHE